MSEIVFYSYMNSIKNIAETYDECFILHRWIMAKGIKFVVELGINTGFSTVAIAMAVKENAGKMISIDINDCPVACSNIKMAALDGIWTFFKEDSCEWIRKNPPKPDDPIDLLFIDSEHTEKTTYEELSLYHSHINLQGSIFLHDTKSFQYPGVLSAVYKFLSEHEDWTFRDYNTKFGLGLLQRK